MKINFLQNIYLPVLIGEKRQKGITAFRKDYEYKYATCKYEADISQDNYNNLDGLILECHLPVNRFIRFQGPLQIKPFTDYVSVSQVDKDGKTSVKMVGIQFDIISSSNIEGNDEEVEDKTEEKIEDKKSELNKVEESNEIKEEEKQKETIVEETSLKKNEEEKNPKNQKGI